MKKLIILILMSNFLLFSNVKTVSYKEKIWDATKVEYNELIISRDELNVVKISGYKNDILTIEEAYNILETKVEFLYSKRYKNINEKQILVYDRNKDDTEIIYYNNGKVLRDFMYYDKIAHVYLIKAYDENGNLILQTATRILSDGLMDSMKVPIFLNLVESKEFQKVIK